MPAEAPTRVGALYLGARTTFRVWAPFAERVDVHVTAPFDKTMPLERGERGYHEVTVESVEPGARYLFRIREGAERPDPASRFQRDGVHAPSEVCDPEFPWTDWEWRGRPLRDYVLYELHVGAFTAEGTFDAVVAHLDELAELGVTAIEIMPVAQFAGARNWGYDGVYPYAPQSTYGGPAGLKRLVNECHARELGVVLDVVYNHLGPEGNYLNEFGPYFTDRYRTPWGRAINFDDRGSDEVRNYFVGNALYWLDEFHVDALRLDAVHSILDTSALPFLEELAAAVDAFAERTRRNVYLIAESAANDSRVVAPREYGGLGLHAQWDDDFHHSLAALVTGERDGYYADYGTLDDVARAMRDGFVYQGEHSAFRDRRHGRPADHVEPGRLVVFSSNHDQVGNRALGDRPSTRVTFEQLKLLAGAVLLSPFVPLLFMGEEYGETAPFAYFVDHSNPRLIEAVRRGRREEFPTDLDAPDPAAEETFLRSKLDHGLAHSGPHAALRRYYREVLSVRAALGAGDRAAPETAGEVLVVRRAKGVVLFNFGAAPATAPSPLRGVRAIDSSGEAWEGPGASSPAAVARNDCVALQPHSVVCYLAGSA
jgi:maltooligosyltrehalose trehalohydrolase